MKLLVLGNGFDIDHGLPTSYADFMRFCQAVVEQSDIELNGHQKEYLKKISGDKSLNDKFKKLLKDNCLFRYFLKRIDKLGPDWIDLEREIKSVIQEFRIVEQNLQNSNQTYYQVEVEEKIFYLIDALSLDTDLFLDDIALNNMHKELCAALDDFSLALELYISHFINGTTISGVSPDIVEFEAKKVLVFNYSNTYERVYAGLHWDEQIDYVHGKAIAEDKESPNIILGITSPHYNVDESAGKDEGYVEFEKYFQRITKKTGNEYMKWIDSCKESKEPVEIVFFGHSLDFSDSDIIKDLICLENANIVIYYYNENAHKQIIANLIEIVGKKKLISMVSGETPKISLVQQKQHLKTATAGISVKKDIRELCNLHSLSESQIDSLLETLADHISQKDIDYFHSQRQVIGLLDILRWNDLKVFTVDDFYDICTMLPYEKNKMGTYKPYKYEEWYDGGPRGESPCSNDVVDLIDRINDYNETKYKEDIENIPYMYLNFITDYNEFEQEVLRILNDENPTTIFWNRLHKIISMCIDNKNFQKFFNEFDEDTLTRAIKARYRYLYRLYDALCFQIEELEQYVDEKTYD